MRYAIIWLLFLTACVTRPPEQETLWRDVTGAKRDQGALETDGAACQFEVSKMGPPVDFRAQGTNRIASAILSGPPPQAFQQCMRAKGWQQVAG